MNTDDLVANEATAGIYVNIGSRGDVSSQFKHSQNDEEADGPRF
jgi:hypothetical protein